MLLVENGVLVDTEISDDDLNSKCKEAAVQLVIQKLREKIEMQYLHMQRRHNNVQKQSSMQVTIHNYSYIHAYTLSKLN